MSLCAKLFSAAAIGWIATAGAAIGQAALTGVVHAPAGDVQGLSVAGVGAVSRHSLCRASGRRIALAAAAAGGAMGADAAGDEVRQHLSAAAARRVRGAEQDRGLPLSQRLHAGDRRRNTSAQLPVMVWFHGGGLFSGESNDYDGSKLASRGRVVVVTLNYRVGALGFFSHPAINAEGHPFANYGIMDEQLALRWVQANIAGVRRRSRQRDDLRSVRRRHRRDGEPRLAAFERAVSPGDQPERNAHRASRRRRPRSSSARNSPPMAGCTDQSPQCLRALSVDQVLAHQGGILGVVPDFPSVDGTIITRTALDAYASGQFNRVPIMTGLVRDEQAFFLPEANTKKPLTADDFMRYTVSFGAAHKDKLLAKYPLADYPSPSLAEIAMAQGAKACTARLLDRTWSKFVPVYAYEFADRTAPSYFPDVSYPMRAYHTAELQYLFPRFRGGQGTSHPLSDAQERLSDLMVDYWTTFARTGTLDGGRLLPPWPRYSAEKDNVLVLDLPGPKTEDNYGKANDCALWDSILDYR